MKRLLLYGLLTGILVAGWMYLEFLAGFHQSAMGRYTSYIMITLMILGIVLGMLAYRNHLPDRKMDYWQCVWAGVIISAVAGLITGLFTYCYYQFINPAFPDFLVQLSKDALLKAKANAAVIAENETNIRQKHQAWPQAFRTFGGFAVTGSLFSIIAANFIKNKRFEITKE